MNPVIMIPARIGSTRLSRKMLLPIAGEPMIVHAWRIAHKAGLGPTYVACDDPEIANVIQDAGGQTVLTDPDLPSGSDRIWAALQSIDPKGKHDTVINLQGDIPQFNPALLKILLRTLKGSKADIVSLVNTLEDARDIDDPNRVKVVVSDIQQLEELQHGQALYFSRLPVPYQASIFYHHIGMYAYRRQALEKFVQLPPSPIELAEKLEQLRALAAGMSIRVALTTERPQGVDVDSDLQYVQSIMSMSS